jgi:hypothetical protein
MVTLVNRMNHYLSGPWLYCRLRDLGVSKKWAIRISVALKIIL